MRRTIRFYVVVLAAAFWLGGLTFYVGIVVPTGTSVLGSSEQGFVTQQVTHWLNLIGAVVMLILLFNAMAEKSRLLFATLAVMAIVQVGLFVLHWQLSRSLDVQARTVTDSNRFSVLHETYEFITAVQWVAGLVHVWGIIARLTR